MHVLKAVAVTYELHLNITPYVSLVTYKALNYIKALALTVLL
jgi:hypothetical protein